MLEEGRAFLVVTGVSIAIAVVMAWSTIGDLDRRLFGRDLVGREHDPFTVMEQYAAGAMPPPHLQPATDAPGIAFTALLGPVPAYNLLTLVTFPLTAALAFLHARYLIGSSLGAGVAALLFAFAPFHVAHAAYHVHIAQVQWLPLAFLLMWRLVEQPGPARAVMAGAGLVLVAAASAYLGLVVFATAPVAATVAAWAARDRRRYRLAYAMAAWAAAAAVWLLVIGLAAPGVLQRAPSLAFPSFALDLHAAQPWRYVALPDDHALLGTPPLSPRGAGAVEQQLALGWSVLILALVGLIVPVPHDHRWRRLRPALVVTAAAAVLCSLPPTLAIGSAMLPMPSQALHALAPMFRAFARFGVLVSLGVSVLAGAGATWLFTRRSRQTRALAATLVAVAAIEYFPPRPLSRDVLPTAMHRAMAAATGARVLDCTKPTTGATAGLGLLMQPEVVIAAGALADCAEPQFGAKLAAFGFTHLIVRRDADPLGVLATGASPPGTTRQAGDTSAALYEVVAPRPDVYLIALEGFSTREFRAGDTWRWMGSSASVTLANLTSGPLPAMLELELEPFAGARSIEVRSHTGWLGAMTVDRRERFRLGPIPVEPGETTVTLTADRVVAPAEVGAGADPRPLSVRLRGWRVAATERQP